VIGKSLKPTERTTSPVGYFRLHGRRYDTWFTDDPEVPSFERYNYLYSEEELEPWVKRVEHVAKHAENTFVIGNNHYIGKAAVNALQLIHLLRKEKVKVPEPLRQHYPQLDSIASEPPKRTVAVSSRPSVSPAIKSFDAIPAGVRFQWHRHSCLCAFATAIPRKLGFHTLSHQ